MRSATIDKDFLRLRHAALLGLFTGSGVGFGYLLAGVPGVELMTLNAALAGVALGAIGGATVGGLSAAMYSLASPFGPPVPLLLAAQACALASAGALGAAVAPVLRRSRPPAAAGLAACAGLVAAVWLDLLTNLAAAVAVNLPLVATLLAGLPVAVLHAGTTAAGFAALLPLLARRLRGLQRRGPRVAVLTILGGLLAGAPAPVLGSVVDLPPAGALAAADTLQTAPQDTLPIPPSRASRAESGAAAADSSGRPTVAAPSPARPPASIRPPLVNNWQRPLWQPFAGSVRSELQRNSPWLPVADGGLGSAVYYFGEPGTAAGPRWTRDGVPLGVGHRFLDDPEALIGVGCALNTLGFGWNASGGMNGAVDLSPLDPAPDRDLVDTRWWKGRHETYLRDVNFLTAAAPWRLQFAFGELLDNEGYDFRVPGETRYTQFDVPEQTTFPGHAKVRAGRGTVTRDLGEAGSLTWSFEQARKLKSALPAYGLEHHDLWTKRAVVDWRLIAGGRSSRLALWWVNSDADWDRRRSTYRKQEASATGLLGAWGDAAASGRLEIAWHRWALFDSGADPAWAQADTLAVHARGAETRFAATRVWTLAGAVMTARAGAWWDDTSGEALLPGAPHPGFEVQVTPAGEGAPWLLSVARGGRAPRSDELATAWRSVVPGGRRSVALPNPALQREREWRAAAAVRPRLAGFDLALEVARRRLRNGIGWQPLAGSAATGRWQNGVELDATTVRAGLARQGRFWGWLRISADIGWHTWTRHDELRIALPPQTDWRVAALWENHFFREDGILQLGWYLHQRGAMDDPWFLADSVAVPAATSLDMVASFRLLGADLGVELLNLTGAGARLSAGAVAPGSELRWRLHWVFHY